MSTLVLATAPPEPAPAWPLEFLRRWKEPGSERFPLIDIAGPLGNVKISTIGIASDLYGNYKAKVIDGGWPQFGIGPDETEASLSTESFDIEIDDGDGEWKSQVMGVSGGDMYRAIVTVRLGCDRCDSGMWPSVWSGIVTGWTFPRHKVARITVRQNDLWLNAMSPKRIIRAGTFPAADKTVIGQAMPQIYGPHEGVDAYGTPTEGILPAYEYDTVNHRFFLCLGYIPVTAANLQVFNNGALKTGGGVNYTAANVLRNGYYFTEIDWTGAPTGAVTVNVKAGYDDVGDLSGVEMTSPMEILLHWILNFGYEDWRNPGGLSGGWITPGNLAQPSRYSFAPVDVDSFLRTDQYLIGNRFLPRLTLNEATKQSPSRYKCSFYLNSQTQVASVIAKRCENSDVRPYFTDAGLLAVKPISHRETRTRHVGPMAVNGDAETFDFAQTDDTSRLVDKVSASVYGNTVDDVEAQTDVIVSDPSMGWNVPLTKDNDSVARTPIIVVALAPNFDQLDPGWTVVNPSGATSLWAALNDPPGRDDGDVSRVTWTTAPSSEFRLGHERMPPASAVVRVSVVYDAKGTGKITPGLRVAGVDFSGTQQTLAAAYPATPYSFDWLTNPAGGAWLKTAVDLLQSRIDPDAVANTETVTQVYLEVAFVGAPRSEPMVREVLSHILNMLRLPIRKTVIKGDLGLAGLPVMEPFGFTYSLAEAPGTTAGWSNRTQLLVKRVIDLNDMTAELRCLDMRNLIVPLWETDAQSDGYGLVGGSPARLGAWRPERGLQLETRRYRRNSKAWDYNGIDNLIYQVDEDVERAMRDGLHIEQASTNKNGRSAFIGGVADVTPFGTGVNGSSVTDLDPFGVGALFSVETNARRIRIVTGTPNTTETGFSQGTFSVTNGTRVVIAIAGNIQISFTPSYWAQRASDSKYWRESDDTWQVAKTFNPLPLTQFTTSRYISKAFDPLATTTITVGVSVPSGGGDGKNFSIMHIQVEDAPAGRSASSYIVTSGGTAVTRAADVLYVRNHMGDLAHPLERYSFLCQFTPDWSSADAASTDTFVFFDCEAPAGDANNYERLFYNNGVLTLRRRMDSVNYDATIASAIVRGTTYLLGARALGVDGDMGLSPYTLSVFLNKVKGTDVVAVPHNYIPVPYDAYYGSDVSGANQINGYFKQRRVKPWALTDAEMGAHPRGF